MHKLLDRLKNRKASLLVTEVDDNTILHRDDTTMVTPSWLTCHYSRYAIRTINRLDFKQVRRRTVSALVGFFTGIALVFYSVYQLRTSDVQAPVLWALLIVSLGWLIIAFWLAFLIKPYFKVTVLFRDGSSLPIRRNNYREARKLLDGITYAMDWHRHDDIVINANRASHVRRRIATKTTSGSVDVESEQRQASNDEYAEESGNPIVQKQSTQMGRILPFLAAMFNARNR